jgi:cbb3-type cytochrome oxidase subunit 1
MIALTVAGLMQAAAWEEGTVVYRTAVMASPFMGLRAFSGLLIVIGQVLLVYNILMTVFGGQEPEEPMDLA